VTDAIEAARILSDAPASLRVAYFGALLAREAGIDPDEMIVVGGSAIEIYTRGGCASGDIDIVGPRRKLLPVLRSWGFEPGDMQMWSNKGWRISVDIRKELTLYNGSRERTRLITTPFGGVRIEGVEDAMVRRLVSAKHWKQPGDFGHALAVATAEKDNIDWGYAEQYARRELVEDLLTELRRRLGVSLP
jgi:hypothetical protein